MREMVLRRDGVNYSSTPVETGALRRATFREQVLFVSDDEQVRALLCELIVAHGYACVSLDSVTALVSRKQLANCDVAIVDTSVSYADAMRAFRKLKNSGNASTIIIAGHGVAGANADLAANGDVLLVKPFDPRELVSIIRGMLRGRAGAGAQRQEFLSVGPITLHTLLNTLTVAARDVELTGAETRVLEELLVNASNPVSRDRLTRRALGREWSPFDRSLDSHIKRLRRKIGEDRRGRTPIRTIRGTGYLLLADWEPQT